MGWPSRLTYQQVAATGIARSLTVLVSYGDVETATRALAADPSLADDPEALAAAAHAGHEPLVRLILQHRPRVVERIAVAAKSRELTTLLFERGMNPNLAGWLGVTPLHRFAREGNVDAAAVFLDHGANLHARDEEFCTTPLGYAAAAGQRRMVEFLLERGAKVSLPDDLEWATPASLATYRGHHAEARLLKARVTDPAGAALTPLRQLRLVALLEGTSFLILLFIAMPLKYLAGLPLAVRIVGSLHGVLFLVFLGALYRAGRERRWPYRRWLVAFVSSVVPFGTFIFDRSLRREIASLRHPV